MDRAQISKRETVSLPYKNMSFCGREVFVLPGESTPDDLAREITRNLGKYDANGAVYISHLDRLIENYQRWKEYLPRVDMFYAMKCNDDEMVLLLLHQLGVRFECASQREVETVINLGVRPEDVVIGNPTRTGPCLRYFASHGIDLLAVDSEKEMAKIKKLHPKARLLLRVRIVPDSENDVEISLGLKFGCHPNDSRQLLEKAIQLELDVVGITFHIGSGILNTRAYASAIEQVAPLYDIAREIGFDMTILNIGGGIHGGDMAIEKTCEELNRALNIHFPASSGVRVIAEPGRFLVTSLGNLYINILNKREKKALVRGYNALKSDGRRPDSDRGIE
ncbi:ornithine decarboxylase-like [Lineus longissimus]|uniref:ornithine decarboxylase-like n=1 Tax=Lineus longissimus TaxID=88925 RepID=UPI00315D6AA3